MTLDNNEAQIVVGQEVPFVTGSYTSTGNSGSNPGDPFQTIERENVGITLKVTPHINDGDQITLDIMQEVSGLVGTSIEANTPIVTNERKIETSVSTADGETIILGGLMSDEIQESVSKVPLLGDIPLLGRLFKSSATTVVKKNLMIFIRPTVVRDAVTAADVSQEQYRRVRDVQMYKEKRGVDLFNDEVLPVLPNWQEQLEGAPFIDPDDLDDLQYAEEFEAEEAEKQRQRLEREQARQQQQAEAALEEAIDG